MRTKHETMATPRSPASRLQLERQEQELRRHRDRLAELVEEQTAELRAANERLAC